MFNDARRRYREWEEWAEQRFWGFVALVVLLGGATLAAGAIAGETAGQIVAIIGATIAAAILLYALSRLFINPPR